MSDQALSDMVAPEGSADYRVRLFDQLVIAGLNGMLARSPYYPDVADEAVQAAREAMKARDKYLNERGQI